MKYNFLYLGLILLDVMVFVSLDYFDTELGVLNNKESPSLSDFAISLLREILLELGQSNKLYPKLRLGTFLLHLGTR